MAPVSRAVKPCRVCGVAKPLDDYRLLNNVWWLARAIWAVIWG